MGAGLNARHRNRQRRRISVSQRAKATRYLYARKGGLRRFAGVLLVLTVALCALAVFA